MCWNISVYRLYKFFCLFDSFSARSKSCGFTFNQCDNYIACPPSSRKVKFYLLNECVCLELVLNDSLCYFIIFIRYTPGASEVLKFAWIQYMSFFLVIAFVLFRLNEFVFRHQVIKSSFPLRLSCSQIYNNTI